MLFRTQPALQAKSEYSLTCTNLVQKPNNVVEELGIFAKCQNEWCLQKGLQKPQHTKCESVTNNGKTCNNPEIKYGTVTGGLPWEYPSNNYEKWCEQLGGFYASHTLGRRTGHPVHGCTGYDDPENWLDKPCCDWSEMIWYNKSLPRLARRYPFVTCVTCTNVPVEEPNSIVKELNNTGEGFKNFAPCSNEWCLQKGLQKPQHKNSSSNSGKWCEQSGGVYVSHITIGTRTNYAVCGCKYYDDPGNWHWCDLRDGYWYNQSLDYHETSSNFITSITCTSTCMN